MSTTISNPCPRCGKPRVDGKKWTEMVGISKVTYTMLVCPDKKCQELLEKQRLQELTERENQVKARLASKTANASKRVSIKI